MILDRWKRNWASRINVGNYSNRILDKYRHPRNRCYLLFYLLSVGYRTFCNVFSFIYLFFFFRSIPYTAIQSATSQRRMFHLVYLSLDGEETSLNFKLDSSQSASGLYRAITEKHAFYSCETVRSAVTAQFIRDLKVRTMLYCYLPLKGIDLIACSSSQGTIISIFNEDSTLGKKYVFDIRRTCREVYDNARRALYCEAATVTLPEEKEILEKHDCGDCEEPKCKVSTRGGKGGKRKGNNFF